MKDEDVQVLRSASIGSRSSFLLAGLLVLMVAGYGVLRGESAMRRGNEMNVDRAVFTVVNAATLTGLRTATAVGEYKLAGQVTVFVLMSAGTLTMLITGGWAITRLLKLPYSDAQIAQASAVGFVVAILFGTSLLIAPGVGLWQAIFQSASAFGNVGLAIGRVGGAFAWQTHVVLLPLAFAGGVGIVVIVELLKSVVQARWPDRNVVLMLAATAGVYLAGIGLILMMEWLAGGDLKRAAVVASAEAINSRTAGLPLETLNLLTRSSQWIVLAMMAIGANAGSAAGGIGIVTLCIIARDSAALIGGRRAAPLLGWACAWVGIYLVLVVATTALLAALYPHMPGERLLFVATSAASNVGESHEPLTMGGSAMYVLSGAMLLGRFVPLAIILRAASDRS